MSKHKVERNFVAKHMHSQCKPSVERDKTKYSRKKKHRSKED